VVADRDSSHLRAVSRRPAPWSGHECGRPLRSQHGLHRGGNRRWKNSFQRAQVASVFRSPSSGAPGRSQRRRACIAGAPAPWR
jgi:hypothetical protein